MLDCSLHASIAHQARKNLSHSVLAIPSFLSPANDTMRCRVEVIKGGGTQQAKDTVQHRSVAADRPPSALLPHGGSTDGGSSCPQELSPVSPTAAEGGRATNSSKSRRVSERTMALRRLERFYRELRSRSASELSGQGEAQAGPSHAVMSGTTTVSAAGDGNGGTTELPEAGMYSRGQGNVGSINPTTNAFYSGATTCVGAIDLTKVMERESKASGLLRLRPTTGVRMSLRNYRRSQSDQRLPPRRRKKSIFSRRGEDVQRLLLRAMVGYDWVDDFNGQERRLRRVFTERDVEILEVGDLPLFWESGFLGSRRGIQ